MSAVQETDVGATLHALATELFPISRSLAGPGVRETLDVLECVTGPMARHRFATGERVHDWTVPREWIIREAWIKDPDGRTIVSFADSNLHVVSHSVGGFIAGWRSPICRSISSACRRCRGHPVPHELLRPNGGASA